MTGSYQIPTNRRKISSLARSHVGYHVPMIFQASVEATDEGDYVATCCDPMASARGLSPANALDRLRHEIRYRIELCPCTGVDDDFVELQVAGSASGS